MSSIRRLLLCPEEMEQGHLADLVKGVVGWAVPAQGPDRVGIVSALVAEQRRPIKGAFPAIA